MIDPKNMNCEIEILAFKGFFDEKKSHRQVYPKIQRKMRSPRSIQVVYSIQHPHVPFCQIPGVVTFEVRLFRQDY